jgi:starvation-inducible DNA-binding protein
MSCEYAKIIQVIVIQIIRRTGMSDVKEKLAITLADTYTLYLKTQNYHWHVTGPNFSGLHALFEMQYRELAEAVDEIAERMLTLGYDAPATFKEFMSLRRIEEGNSNLSAKEMVEELSNDNTRLVKDLNQAMSIAQSNNDEGTANLLADRIAAHEKASWMLRASK